MLTTKPPLKKIIDRQPRKGQRGICQWWTLSLECGHKISVNNSGGVRARCYFCAQDAREKIEAEREAERVDVAKRILQRAGITMEHAVMQNRCKHLVIDILAIMASEKKQEDHGD